MRLSSCDVIQGSLGGWIVFAPPSFTEGTGHCVLSKSRCKPHHWHQGNHALCPFLVGLVQTVRDEPVSPNSTCCGLCSPLSLSIDAHACMRWVVRIAAAVNVMSSYQNLVICLSYVTPWMPALPCLASGSTRLLGHRVSTARCYNDDSQLRAKQHVCRPMCQCMARRLHD